MRASAAAVGGELVVESRPGQGTTVRATLGSSPEPEPPPPPSVRTRLRLV
jgi:signal transduction histidine kinase